MRARVELALGRGIGLPCNGDDASGVDGDLRERAEPLGDHAFARVARQGAAGRPGDRGGSRGRALRRRSDRRAGGCRCPWRRRERARALGESASWARTIRTVRTRAPKRVRAWCERSGPGSSSLSLAVARRVGHAPVDRGSSRIGRSRLVGGRTACRGAALLWLAWAGGLLATLAPRPQTLTVLRVIAPVFVVAAVLAAIDGSGSTLAIVGALVATFVCALSRVGSRHRDRPRRTRSSYGDEQRFPLRVPPALFLGPLPLARLLVAAGVVAPVLLLADGDIVLGLVALGGRRGDGLPAQPVAVVALAALGRARARGLRRGRSPDARRPRPLPPRARAAPGTRAAVGRATRCARPATRRQRRLGVGAIRRGGRADPGRPGPPRRCHGRGRRDPRRGGAARRDAHPRCRPSTAGEGAGQAAIPPPTSASPS